VERIFYFILNEPLNLEPLRQTGAPQAVIDLVERCTAKKPDARPLGFGPVVAALERAITAQDEATLVLPTMPSVATVRQVEQVAEAAIVAPAKTASCVDISGGVGGRVGVGGGAVFCDQVQTASDAQPALRRHGADPSWTFLFGKEKQPVKLPAYYIDRTEVSNAAYGLFCSETGHQRPEGVSKPDYPVVNVTIDDARDFAKWAHSACLSRRNGRRPRAE